MEFVYCEMRKKDNILICNYFIRRQTSGWLEGINNKVNAIKRCFYGIINVKHFFKPIFLDFQHYDIVLKKNIQCMLAATKKIQETRDYFLKLDAKLRRTKI